MQLRFILSGLAALSMITSAIATPIRCSDVRASSMFFLDDDTSQCLLQSTRDAILRGDLSPEACCSYGICLGDVVIQSG